MHRRSHIHACSISISRSFVQLLYQLIMLCRRLRAAAVAELQEIFDQGLYSSSDKKVQQAIFEHLLVAAQQRDR